MLLSDTLSYALTDEVAMAFLAAIAEKLTPTGFALTLLPATEQHGMVPARDVAIDGAVVYSCDPDSAALGWLVRRRVPLVFVDQAPAAGIASVNVDDRGGAAAAAQHLVELGNRRVAIVTVGVRGEHGAVSDPLATALSNTERQRLSGWLHTLSTAGITPLVVREGHGDPYETGLAAARTVLDRADPPSGVLCFSDAIARGVVAGVAAAGVRVPDDMSVVGFGDSPLSRLTQPALTTVRQDVREKGHTAANALIAAIDRGKSGASARTRHLLLPTELVVRESSAAAPRAAGVRRARGRRAQ